MWWTESGNRSLRGRLALAVVAGLVAVLAVGFTLLHLLIRDEVYQELDRDLLQRMSGVAEYAAANPGSEDVAEFMPEFRTRAHEDFFQIWDGQGRTLARSDSSAGRDLPRLAAGPEGPSYHDLVLPDGHRGRAIAQVFVLTDGDPREALTVVTAEEVESIDRFEERIHLVLLIAGLVIVLAAVLTSMLSIHRGLRPVEEFTRSLAGVNAGEPRARLDITRLPEELRPAAASFSALLDRLLEALAREKRYARNVAHELRNPLAEIRLLADVGAASPDLRAAQASIRDVGATAAEMERIVDVLLAMTRYEAGLESPQPEPVNLCEELQCQAGGMSGAAGQRELNLRLDLPPECWIYTDSALFRRLLALLLGNAVSHAPRGATVQVDLDAAGGVRIANPAPHLEAGDVPRLGERFYRVGDGDQGPHAGLGLSLAAAIARVLGLAMTLRLREGGWFEVTISGFQQLPAAVDL